MSLNWDVGDSPSPPPGKDPPPRRRAILAAMGGVALLVLAGAALLSWQRRERLATAERAVLAAAELEQQALAANDPDLLTAILPERISRLGQVRLVREAQLPVPGITIVGGRGRPEDVRFQASRPWSVLDRAEVDVRTLVSDAYATGQVLRRRRFAQADDSQWRLDLDADTADRSGKSTPWVGQVLTTTVAAADEALGHDLHAALDADLAAFCAAARTAGRLMAWNSCTFQLLSDGQPTSPDRRTGSVTGVVLYLPSPPGSLVTADDNANAVLRRAYLREMIAQWQGRDRTPVIETLLDAWLAPESALSETADARRDWAQLSADLKSHDPVEQTRRDHQRLVRNLRLLAADVVQARGRHALLGLMLAWPPVSPALWLSEALADEQLEQAILARWDHAPAPLPGDRALLAQCMGSEFGPGRPVLFLPGRYEGRLLDRQACPAGTTAEAAVWRPGTNQLAVQCSNPGLMGLLPPVIRLLAVRADGSMIPVATDWPADRRLLPETLSWSPDGQRLSAIDDYGIFQVWRTDADGGGSASRAETIPDGSYFDHVGWSADSSRASLTPEEFDGSNSTFLFAPMTLLFDPNDARLVARLDLTADAWSPTGARLAAHGLWQSGVLPLALIDGKTGVETNQAEVPLDEEVLPAQPFSLWGSIAPIGWSPDGRWIALLARRRQGPGEVVDSRPGSALIAWRPDDGTTRTAQLPEVIGSTAWAPEGTRVLVASQRLGDAAAGPVTAWSWSPESGVIEESALPPALWSPDGQWGASTVGGTLTLWSAGADRPSWSSEIRDCRGASWQALPGDGRPSPASPLP